MQRVFCFLILLLVAGCGSVRVAYDYERGQDWSAYRTYDFYPDLQSGLSELDERRLLDAVDQVLKERGYRQSEDPDMLINIYGEAYRQAPGNTVGLGVGGTGGNVGGGISLGIPLNGSSLQRQLTFDLIDAARQVLVWQAVSTDGYRETADPSQREARFLNIAEKVFSGFPPRR